MDNSQNGFSFVNLKAFRVANELSQKEVAEYLGVASAFISTIERGLSKLPGDKIVRLLDNDREWETAPLLQAGTGATRIHNDHRSITHNIEGEFNAPIHNNNYCGYSEEEFERELRRRTESRDQQIASLEAEIERLRLDLARECSRYEQEHEMNLRLVGILEKGEFRKGENAQ